MSTDTTAPQRTSESHRRALAVLSTVLFVTFLDNTIVSVTLADVQSDLHAGIQTLQWTVNGYALAFASLMLVGGMLGDLYGRRRVMVAGLALFSAGSVIAALAPSAPWLLAGRVVMGIGAAGSEPGTLSIIRHLYQERESRARAFGVWAAVSGTALAMGPVVAGVLVGFWSWRAVFWFNLVIGGAALVATRLLVPESSDPEGAPLDISGSVLGATALAAAIFAVIGGETAGYTTWWIIALFVLSGAAAVSFVVVELHTERPMLDITLLRRARFTVSNVVAFTTYFGIFSIFFFVALYLQPLGPLAVGDRSRLRADRAHDRRQCPRRSLGARSGPCPDDRGLCPRRHRDPLGRRRARSGCGLRPALLDDGYRWCGIRDRPGPGGQRSDVLDAPGRSGMAASATNTSRQAGNGCSGWRSSAPSSASSSARTWSRGCRSSACRRTSSRS
ncbi:MAG: MFS transporter [Microthrixaceae bacterium]